MYYSTFFNICEQILFGIAEFSARGILWFFTPVNIGDLISVTPFFVLTVSFFSWALVRLGLEFIT